MTRRQFARASAALAATAAAAGAVEKGRLDEAAALIQSTVDSGQLRAASLHVRQGSFTFRRAFGAAKTPDTIFLLASISKPMTAAGVMLLADRGKLSLDDPVHKYIPEFSEGDRKLITIQHLLTHTSGLPDQLPENTELRKRHAPLSEFVKAAIKTPLLFKPGTDVKYQSMGILLASEVAQRITGQAFPAFLDKEVYKPLGMARTAMGLGKFKISDTALSQVDKAPGMYGGGDNSSWDWNSPYWRNLAAPWGGAHSTGPDVAKFLEAFLKPDGKVLKKETAASMIVDHNKGLKTPWGIGFSVRPGSFGKGCSDRTFGHSGSTGTLAWCDPANGASFVILTTLPANVSDKLIIDPVSDMVSEAV
jgi:CubicO group peptidase (beta-lactamase class C family)